jgi:hypothetical protein
MKEVVRLFARGLRRANRPVIFLVDDLDRCDGTYVVEFLEAMQTLVRDAPRELRGSRRSAVAGPYAFIAADGQWIRTSYETHYASFTATAPAGRPLASCSWKRSSSSTSHSRRSRRAPRRHSGVAADAAAP